MPQQFRKSFTEVGGLTSDWWSLVVPSAGAEQDLHALESPLPPFCTASGNQTWSHFDARKLDLAVRLVDSAAAFIRLRAAVRLQQSSDNGASGSLLVEEVKAVVTAFLGLSELIATSSTDRDRSAPELMTSGERALVTAAGTADRGSSAAVTSILVSRLESVCENLVCALHDEVVCLSPELRDAVAPLLEQCAYAVSGFSAHSFLAQAMRWTVAQVNIVKVQPLRIQSSTPARRIRPFDLSGLPPH